jgi:coenzyme PQQ biosynthesis enzyme PqqE
MQTQADPRPAPAAARHNPLGLLAELTHRCPLGCPYCSNPLELARRTDELDTATWARVFREAAGLGVLQVHLSGGEPASRRDLVDITAAARDAGLYTNLITSGVGVTAKSLAALADAGLDHVQISIQDSEAKSADHIAGYAGAYVRKRALAAEVVALKLPLTASIVIHRANIERVDELVTMALDMGAAQVRSPMCRLRLGARGTARPRHRRASRSSARRRPRPGVARPAPRPHRDRRGGARLLCALSQALRGAGAGAP